MSLNSNTRHRPSRESVEGTPSGRGKSFMRKGLGALTVAGLALGGSLLGASAAHAADPVVEDANLLAAINKSIDSTRDPLTPITEAEASSLTQFSGPFGSLYEITGVTTLSGMQGFTSLESFHSTGTFSDVTPLQNLPALQNLRLQSSGLSGTLPTFSGPLRVIEIHGGNFENISNIISAAPDFSDVVALGTRNNGFTSISGVEALSNLVQFETGGYETGTFDGTAQSYTAKSAVADLTPLQNLSELQYAGFPNSSVTDVTPVASVGFTIGDRNFVSDISALHDEGVWAFADQEISLPSAQVDQLIANPLRDVTGATVAASSTAADLTVDADGNWSFSTPGVKTLTFETHDEAVAERAEFFALAFPWAKFGTFSGTVTVNVTEGAITAGDVTVSGTPAIGQELTADASGFQPDDVDLWVC